MGKESPLRLPLQGGTAGNLERLEQEDGEEGEASKEMH